MINLNKCTKTRNYTSSNTVTVHVCAYHCAHWHTQHDTEQFW